MCTEQGALGSWGWDAFRKSPGLLTQKLPGYEVQLPPLRFHALALRDFPVVPWISSVFFSGGPYLERHGYACTAEMERCLAGRSTV